MMSCRIPVLMATAATLFITTGTVAPTATLAATYGSSSQVQLDPGTVIPVILTTELTSNNSQIGDTFTANVDTSRPPYDSVMNGAVVQGIVRDAEPQSGNSPGTLRVAFTRLIMPDGTTYVISGTPTSLDSKNLSVNSNGMLVAKGGAGSAKDNSLTYAGIGAGAGALISLLGNGKLKIEDLLLGGGLGYIAGQVLKQQQQQVHDVDLKPGTPMGVLLGNTVLYHRRGYGGGAVSDFAPVRYYTFEGQRWAYDPNTGHRWVVGNIVTTRITTTTTTTRRFYRTHRKYYSYGGHAFYLDLDTGQRVQLD